MITVNEGLGAHIEAETGSSASQHERFYEANLDGNPIEVIRSTRTLAEKTVGYLYIYLSGADTVPEPYWCLVRDFRDFGDFRSACDKAKGKGRPFPKDYAEAWSANRLLREPAEVTDTLFEEADRVKSLGNQAIHNAQELQGRDLRRTAERCWESCVYILEVVDKVTSRPSKAAKTAVSRRNGPSGQRPRQRSGNRTASSSQHRDSHPKPTSQQGATGLSFAESLIMKLKDDITRDRKRVDGDFNTSDSNNRR